MGKGEINFMINLSYGNNEWMQDGSSEAAMQEAYFLQFIFWGVILPIVSVFGIVGNVLTMIVLWRREMQTTIIYFLRVLVLTDTGIIIVAFVVLTPFSIADYTTSMWYFKDVMYPNLYTPCNYLVMAVQQINVWVTVSVSIERYISICHPFKASRICTKKATVITLIVITIISVLYNIPRFFGTSARHCSEDEREKFGHDCYVLVSTEFGTNMYYKTVYFTWMYTILIYVVPLTVLLFLNVLIIQELMRMRRRQIGTNIQDDNEANLTMVLVLIVVVFIICQTPGLIAQFEIFDVPGLMQWLAVSNTLFVLNSSVNFLIYTAVGRNFRKVLLKIFRKMFGKNVLSDMSRVSRTSNAYELTQFIPGQASDDTTTERIDRAEKRPLNNVPSGL